LTSISAELFMPSGKIHAGTRWQRVLVSWSLSEYIGAKKTFVLPRNRTLILPLRGTPEFITIYMVRGAWGSVVVRALRC
jgi:hypothetical protein